MCLVRMDRSEKDSKGRENLILFYAKAAALKTERVEFIHKEAYKYINQQISLQKNNQISH